MEHKKVLFGEMSFDDPMACIDAFNAHIASSESILATLVERFSDVNHPENKIMNGFLYSLMLHLSFIGASGGHLFHHIQQLESKLKQIQGIAEQEKLS